MSTATAGRAPSITTGAAPEAEFIDNQWQEKPDRWPKTNRRSNEFRE
jgi:hypothetical protein